MRTVLVVAAVAALAACSQETTTETPDTAEVTTPAPAPPPATVISITEADARTRAESAGYTNVTGLMQNPDGSWTATGTQNGQTTQITISDSGVTTSTSPDTTP